MRLFGSSEEDTLDPKLQSCLQKGKILPLCEGMGSSYVAVDDRDKPCFVIKPSDVEQSPRPYIPLYRSALTEVLCYRMALACHLEDLLPRTFLCLISSSCFFYDIEEEKRQEPIDLEKLCSCQEFLQGTRSFNGLLDEWFRLGKSEEEMLPLLDQECFERMNLLLWIIYDCDAHPANFRAYIKGYVGESAIYGLWKIDSSLSFPTKNQGFFSSLALLPNSFLPLSDSLKTAIEQLPCQKMLDLMQELGFEDSMQALQERVLFLQTFTKKEGVTFEEVCKRLVTF